jgi:hypothetical protein
MMLSKKLTTEELSNEPICKLQAAIASTHLTPDKKFQEGYIEACRQWYEELNESDRMVVASACAALNSGKQDKAFEIVAVLPAAPKLG